jgi:hypothetical protein
MDTRSVEQGAAPDFDRRGPRVGERFPDVVLADQHGRPVDLHKTRAGRKGLVVFYRSASW